MRRDDSYRSLMLWFVDLFNSPRLDRTFNALALSMRYLIMCVVNTAVLAAKYILSMLEDNWSRRESKLLEFQFLTGDSLTLFELRIEHARQALRASLAYLTYALRDGQNQELFFPMVHNREYPTSLLYNARFLQLVLNSSNLRKVQVSSGMSVRIGLSS